MLGSPTTSRSSNPRSRMSRRWLPLSRGARPGTGCLPYGSLVSRSSCMKPTTWSTSSTTAGSRIRLMKVGLLGIISTKARV
ncbi:hypothetical protein HU200_013274 [Digitaria exilis]|uniref:Uncharacterized protein n=1 Tax=Digitaria exilis TaxID=1010633 RepID=A0A835FE72_9POAL|nr:hypothetical protein HU200_013274 [Digitaria exilis]